MPLNTMLPSHGMKSVFDQQKTLIVHAVCAPIFFFNTARFYTARRSRVLFCIVLPLGAARGEGAGAAERDAQEGCVEGVGRWHRRRRRHVYQRGHADVDAHVRNARRRIGVVPLG